MRSSASHTGALAPATKVGISTDLRVPEPEVSAKAKRRRFTAEYKRRILKEADACTKPGEVGALLRREGLYSSHLASWRAARERGELAALKPKRRGPKPKQVDPRDRKLAALERENARLRGQLEKANIVIDAQKKMAKLLEQLPDEETE